MSGKYLLDTSVIIALFAGDEAVLGHLEQAAEVFVPSIALGELYYGAWKSANPRENLNRIDELVSVSAVLGCDALTARFYGKLKNGLRLKGRPIPENDIWIAAIALQHHLTVSTRDEHFREIDGLEVEFW